MTEKKRSHQRAAELSLDDYQTGVLACDRTIIARGITLVESDLPEHAPLARELIQRLLPASGNSIRIGITGVPGAGKSSFIEALGNWLIEQGHKLAVLAVDPSSNRTRGSILGDKTRMEQLARNPQCFIRPSPSSGTLGGVSRKTRETVLLCEAAGFDVILVETIGVGQSEIAVRALVDFFLLLTLTGAGDELQGFKKGVMELADALLVHKADGDNRQQAANVRSEYERVLHYFAPATPGWQTPVQLASSLDGTGISEIWQVIQKFRTTTTASGVFAQRRREQLRDWLHSQVQEQLLQEFHHHPQVERQLLELEQAVMTGDITASAAADRLLEAFRGGKK
jgi:LAO/AO transport system kinase